MLFSPMNSDIAATYDAWSQSYDDAQNPTRDLAGRALRESFRGRRSDDVLEIGCGTGWNTRFLADQSRSVIGMDFSQGMLRQARTRIAATNVRFVVQDIQRRWQLPEAAVDRVVCTLVLEHIAGLASVFHEAFRVLRPGGEFFLCELHPFRQLLGRQARFTSAETNEETLVAAFLHDTSDHVNAGLESGFTLRQLKEWRDLPGTDEFVLPRVLSLRFGKEKERGIVGDDPPR